GGDPKPGLLQLLVGERPRAGRGRARLPPGESAPEHGRAVGSHLGHALRRLQAPVRGDVDRRTDGRVRDVLRHPGSRPRRAAAPPSPASAPPVSRRPPRRPPRLMTRVPVLTGELDRVLGRALALGEDASFVLARALTIVFVLVLGALAYRLFTGFIRHLVERLDGGRADVTAVQRARTLGPLLANVARWVIGFVAGLFILQELGVDVRALAVSAGVLGVAVGLGAQSLIRDVITGFFLLFENLIGVGDVIEVGAHTGVVESVGLRVTKLRKFSGELRIVPNGELTTFGQLTAGWSRAIVEATVHPDVDVGAALRVLDEVGRAWQAAHPAHV